MSTSIKNLANRSTWFFHRAATRQATVALSDQAAASLNNFLTGILIGRFCAKEQFGLYTLCFTIVLFVSNLQLSLISSPYIVYSSKLKGKDLALYSGSTLIHQLTLSLLTVVILSVFGIALSLGIGPVGLERVVWALVPAMIFILLKEYVRQFFFAHQCLTRAFLLDTSVLILQIGCLYLLSTFKMLSASSAYWVIGAACGLITAFWLILMRGNFAIRREQWVSDFLHNWSFAKWLVVGSLAFLGSTELYLWFLAAIHGPGATGSLAACMGAIYLANPFLMGMGNFLAPKIVHAFVHGGVEDLERIVTKSTLVFTFTMGGFCLLMILFGGRLVALLYGNQYAGNNLAVGVLALSQLASALTFPTNYGLNALERPDVGFKSYLLALAVTLTLGLPLVKSFSLTGVAFGLLSGNILASTFRCLIFRKQLRTLSLGRADLWT